MPQPPLIMVDMDDVLCQTNAAAVKWHNNTYGTRTSRSILIRLCYIDYHWWKNPGWGTPSQTRTKADMFYASLEFLELATPLPGAVKVLQALKRMGYRIAIVTARSKKHLEITTAWVEKWMGGIFESVHFTGDKLSVTQSFRKVSQRQLTKGEVCEKFSACLLIDDSVENVLSCVTTSSWRIPALLFGGYGWGQRNSHLETPEDFMSFEERQQHEVAIGRTAEWWKEDRVNLPEGVWRMNDWEEVLKWIQGFGKEIISTSLA